MADIIIDFERRARCGVEEAIFCASKSTDQIEKIVRLGEQQQTSLLFTRLEKVNTRYFHYKVSRSWTTARPRGLQSSME